jgi:hypothetical protein
VTGTPDIPVYNREGQAMFLLGPLGACKDPAGVPVVFRADDPPPADLFARLPFAMSVVLYENTPVVIEVLPDDDDVGENDRRAIAQAIGEANGGAVGLGQLVNAFGAVAAARFDLGPAEELSTEATATVLDALADLARRRGWGGA